MQTQPLADSSEREAADTILVQCVRRHRDDPVTLYGKSGLGGGVFFSHVR